MRLRAIKALSVRRSLASFLVVVVGLAIWQVTLSWLLMKQDSDLASRRTGEHLEQVADLAVSQIASSLAKWELVLRNLDTLPPASPMELMPPAGNWLILLRSGSVTIYPGRSLLFVPTSAPGAVPITAFEAADRLEFQMSNYQGAIDLLRPLVDAPATRAEALLRLARLEKKLRHRETALEYYERLSRETTNNSDSVPYALLAAGARCEMLPHSSCPVQLRAALLSGRWAVSQEVFEYYWAELNRWQGTSEKPPRKDFDFSLLINRAYERWQTFGNTDGGMVSREITPDGSLLMCYATRSRLALLFAAGDWRANALHLPASATNIHLQWFTSSPPANLPSPHVLRSLAEVALKGKLDVSATPPTILRSKQLLWLAGVGLMLVLVIGGAYATYRGITRELRLAQLQSDFVAAVSHEFRSPLTALKGITELLVDGRLGEPSQLQRSFTLLQREITRLQRLVEDLLDFGRMESGQKPYRRELHDAFGVVRAAIEDFQRDSNGQGFHIEVDLAAERAGIEANQEALKTVLRNLLENAVKYSLNCRTVWVEGRVARHEVAISVRDQGMGIAPSEQHEIFKKFVRGTAAKTAGIKGTGIGLSMVRQIVQASGGEVQLQSSPGVGSTFTILLPLANEREKIA